MHSLASLWKNAPRWRVVVIVASICTIIYLIKGTRPSTGVTTPPIPPQCQPNDPSCTPSTQCLPPGNLTGSYKRDSDPENPVVTLIWKNPFGSNAQSWIVQRKKENERDSKYQNIATLTPQTEKHEDRVTFGSIYNYRIKAVCSGRHQEYSNTIDVNMKPSYRITRFTVEQDRNNLSYVELNWEGVGDRQLTRFSIRRRTHSDPQQPQEIERTPLDSMQFYTDRDRSLKPGITYCYQIIPNLVDGTEGGASSEQCYTLPLSQPQRVKAERTAEGIRLTWEWPEDSLQEVPFVIERSDYIRDRWRRVGETQEKAYLDEEAKDRRATYFYRISAIDRRNRSSFPAEIRVD